METCKSPPDPDWGKVTSGEDALSHCHFLRAGFGANVTGEIGSGFLIALLK